MDDGTGTGDERPSTDPDRTAPDADVPDGASASDAAAAPAPEGTASPTETTPDRRRRRVTARLVALVAAVVLAVVGLGLVGWVATHQDGPPPAPAESVAAGPPPPPSAALPAGSTALPAVPDSPPARLRIASLGVSSPVDQVGLNPDRTMEVPAKGPVYDHAAWYRYSVSPGRQGPSVIIGHVDSREEGPSVFYDLGRMRPGDRADVTRADGTTIAFLVTAVRSVPKDAFPTAEVYGPTAGPELRLITCGGSFDADARSYRDNTVVFAREIERATP